MATNYVLGPSAARKVKALLGGAGKVTRREGAASALAFDADYPAPFAVQWAQSAKEGEGAWIIWLPGEKLVVTAIGPLDPSKDLTAVGGDYPDGWYLLDDTMLDKDKGGTLYLCIALGKSETATFADSPAGASTEEYDVEICTASVNSTTGERTVKQFVSSAIVLGTGDDTDTQYGADGKSISLTDAQSAGELLPHEGKHFYLNGFGKFQFDGDPQVHGSFTPAGSETVNIDDDETEFAVLCRTGNKETPNANALTYSKLKFKGSGGSSPFAYEKSTKISDLQTVTTHKLVNCGFYWNGEYKSLPDFDVSGLLGGGSVFLRGQQAEPSSSSPDPSWEWSLGTSAASAPSGGKVLNYKLYDFAASKVAIDYRTTFLALEDHTPKAQVLVTKPNGNASILLDATGDQPKLVITDGTKTIALDLSQIPDDCSGAFGIRTISWTNADGEVEDAHVIGCYDIDLTSLGASAGIKLGSDNMHLKLEGNAETGYVLSVPKLAVNIKISGGTGIKVVQAENSFGISNTGVTGIYGDPGASGASVKLNGDLSIVCNSSSGLEFVTKNFTAIGDKNDYTGGRLELDFKGRDADTKLGIVDVTLGGETEPVAKVVGSTDFEIAQRKLVAGKGITITESADGSEATISAEGEETPDETFTGTKTVVVDVDYDAATHSLRKRTATVTVKDGRIVKWIEAASYVAYTTAVEES